MPGETCYGRGTAASRKSVKNCERGVQSCYENRAILIACFISICKGILWELLTQLHRSGSLPTGPGRL